MTPDSTKDLFRNLNDPDQAGDDAAEQNDAPISELEMLKQRARVMGIPFSNAIKLESLKAKIQAKFDSAQELADDSHDEQDEAEAGSEETAPAPSGIAPVSTPPVPAAEVAPLPRKLTLREKMVAEQMALLRCRITNMDPKKADLPGEIFTFANEVLGTVRKYVPYGEVTDDGYHIPVCIYNQLVERTFVSIKTVKNKNGRGTTTTTTDAREFAIDVLPPLTVDELARLANAQAAAAGN